MLFEILLLTFLTFFDLFNLFFSKFLEKHCGKLWTFDRVIGYIFEDKPEKEVQNVELRADCEDLCLAEKSFSCRSATFDYTNKLCKLFSETRRSKPSVFKPTKNDIDYLENQCIKGMCVVILATTKTWH